MTQTTPTAQPQDHPAWVRAAAEPSDPQRAMDLAQQVCQVTPERDWLLVATERSAVALLDVLVPAVDAMYAQWIDDLDTERDAQGSQATARREAFAALAAATAYSALTCSKFALAKVMAFRSRTTGQAERSVALAEIAMDGALVACPWEAADPAVRAAVAADVLAHRAGAAR